MLAESLSGWRRVEIWEHKTKLDWAEEIRILLEKDFPQAKKIKLVCDNLNTHTMGAFYEKFERSLARSLVERLEIINTPKHGSWLNIAENELSALTRQCVKGCRFATIEALRRAVEAWMNMCNANKKDVLWQFTNEKQE